MRQPLTSKANSPGATRAADPMNKAAARSFRHYPATPHTLRRSLVPAASIRPSTLLEQQRFSHRHNVVDGVASFALLMSTGVRLCSWPKHL
jgi:hypothetical protein